MNTSSLLPNPLTYEWLISSDLLGAWKLAFVAGNLFSWSFWLKITLLQSHLVASRLSRQVVLFVSGVPNPDFDTSLTLNFGFGKVCA
ncbi:hypothetical protein GALMADRAFT_235389 [Galerina marginata CBS 339.88]|uniref:Uncharacterized protein n=1 Tax=Galerina marginata (strain CBS 339.88) TaxID=685588 RepID=A0A067U3X9_GALM3|nr:hypothetical protein GALMADRAFT_235389 [Galerina marginata CBS 339.88]